MILLGQKRKYDEFLSGEVELIKSDLKRMKLTGDATDSADEPKQPSSPRGDGLFKKRYTFDTPMRQRVLNLSDNWGVRKILKRRQRKIAEGKKGLLVLDNHSVHRNAEVRRIVEDCNNEKPSRATMVSWSGDS